VSAEPSSQEATEDNVILCPGFRLPPCTPPPVLYTQRISRCRLDLHKWESNSASRTPPPPPGAFHSFPNVSWQLSHLTQQFTIVKFTV